MISLFDRGESCKRSVTISPGMQGLESVFRFDALTGLLVPRRRGIATPAVSRWAETNITVNHEPRFDRDDALIAESVARRFH